MQTAAELKNLLQCIDHKGYPAYKDTRGTYEFPGYVLSIDHVQGDPFAAPSKVSIHVRGNGRDSRNIFIRKIAEESLCRIVCCASLRARSRKFPLKRKVPERAVLWRSAVRDRKC